MDIDLPSLGEQTLQSHLLKNSSCIRIFFLREIKHITYESAKICLFYMSTCFVLPLCLYLTGQLSDRDEKQLLLMEFTFENVS